MEAHLQRLYQLELTRRNDLLNQSNDPNIGSARNGSDDSTSQDAASAMGVNTSSTSGALLSTFAPTFLLSCIWIIVFLSCRRTQRRFYSPRSYFKNIPEHEKTVELPSGWFSWIKTYWSLTDTYVLQHVSLDGYFFLRFLRLVSTICFFGALGIWPILFPIHATGGGKAQELDQLNFSNVTNPKKYYAHVIVSWMFFAFIFYMVVRECIFYAGLRQAYLTSPMVSSRLSARTVLFMSVPHSYLDKTKLRRVFGDSLNRVWLATETEKLDHLVDKRDEAASRLEFLETKLVRKANKARMKYIKKYGNEAEIADLEAGLRDEGVPPFAAPWASKIKRPTSRLSLFGEKVDTISHLRKALQELIPQVDRLQLKHKFGKAKYIPAVFVEFKTQSDAELAYQTLAHHQPFTMSPRYIGVPPDQVIWPALKYSWLSRLIRKFAIQGGIAALIIFWSIPSAFVGTISNINYLTQLLPFLKWMDDLPAVIMAVISGVLPAAGLALLMSLVPIILRGLARQTGVPSIAKAELFMQNANFCFQVIQVFLVTTLTSAASAAVGKIVQDPLSLKDLLAQNLPKASNFYISYFLMQGLVLSTGAVVQLTGYLAYKIMRLCFDSTPRRVYKRWSSLSPLSWGTVFPTFTNMGVIAITYSCIAPLILGFASFGLFLVYHAYRYNLLFVYDCNIDTKGLVYPRALQQLLTGIYLSEICMIGLFAIKGAIGPLVLMVLFTILTALGHISLNEALAPLLEGLPRSLDEREIEEDVEANDEIDALSVASGDGNLFQKAARAVGKLTPKTSRNFKVTTKPIPQPPRIDSDDSEITLGSTDGSLSPCAAATSTSTSTDANQSSEKPTGASTVRPENVQPPCRPRRFARAQTHRFDVTPTEMVTSPRLAWHRFFEWFFYPDIYANPILLSKKMRRDLVDPYDDGLIAKAYFPPSVRSPHPLLWIPHDEGGVSAYEVHESTKDGIIRMTDHECHLNENNKIIWDKIGMRPPIFEEKIFY